jgi:monofunctional glycosyltransferase
VGIKLSLRPLGRGLVVAWKWFCYAIGSAVLVVVAVQAWYFGHICWWRYVNPWETSFQASRLAELREQDPKAVLKHEWIDYPKVSLHLKRAVLVAEDAKFFDHEGFDFEGIQRAFDKNKKQGGAVAGGSTITQQLAKNLFLSGERSYVRKAQEAVITVMLETVLTKERIFEMYLNVAEWGEGVFGCEAGARHYYKVSCAQLTPEQSARMAAMLPRPRFYDKNRNTGYLGAYAARIYARMPQAQLP